MDNTFKAFYGNKETYKDKDGVEKQRNTSDGLGTQVEVTGLSFERVEAAYGFDTALALLHNGLRDKLMGICNNKGAIALEQHIADKFADDGGEVLISVETDVKKPVAKKKAVSFDDVKRAAGAMTSEQKAALLAMLQAQNDEDEAGESTE